MPYKIDYKEDLGGVITRQFRRDAVARGIDIAVDIDHVGLVGPLCGIGHARGRIGLERRIGRELVIGIGGYPLKPLLSWPYRET